MFVNVKMIKEAVAGDEIGRVIFMIKMINSLK